MKTSEILIAAKKHLARTGKDRDKHKFICRAIDMVHHGMNARLLKDEITIRLDYKAGLSLWLFDVHRIPWHELKYEKVQAHRHAWVDMLIAEYQAKGD